MYDKIQMVLGGLVIVMFGLSRLARRYPDVAALQPFRIRFPQPSEEQRAVMTRRANTYAGIELILLGICLPLGYAALTLMMFNSFTPLGIALTLAGSALCIGFGVTAFRRSRRG